MYCFNAAFGDNKREFFMMNIFETGMLKSKAFYEQIQQECPPNPFWGSKREVLTALCLLKFHL